MASRNKNLPLNSKIDNADATKYLTMGLRNIIASGLMWSKDSVFLFTTLALLTKSVLFLGLINNDNATSFNLFKAFSSFSAPPPLSVYVSLIVIALSFTFAFKGQTRFWFLTFFYL